MSLLGTAEVVYNGTPTNDTYLAAVAPLTEDPYKPDNSAFSFEFAGWRLQGASSNGFAQVKGDQTYIAQFAETTKKYRIEFVDDDGETLLHWTQLEYGQTPSYTWDNPANKQDVEWNYSFTGWTPATFSEVQGPQTYVANYDKTKREYTITWLNDDNSLINKTKVVYNEVPTHADATKTSTAEWNYTFTGWDKTLVAVTEDATYKATFSAEKRKYTITWKNGDATIEIDSNVPYGTTPSFDSATPAKAATAQYTYTFSGWSPSVSSVAGDATYTAQFSSTVNKYTITFKNGDDVLQSTDWEYDETPKYTGATPVSPEDNDRYVHPFAGWLPAVTSVTEEAIYMAAFGPEEAKMYPVVWKDWDGTTILEKTKEWGASIPEYQGSTPTRQTVNGMKYIFEGWKQLESEVEQGDVTFKARYSAETVENTTQENTTQVINVTSEEEVEVVTMTVPVGKSLEIAEGGSVNADVLILEATTEEKGEEYAKEEVQVSGELSETGSKNLQTIYYDLTRKHGTEKFLARVWYAVAVPWAVETPNYSNGGVFIKRGEEFIPQRLGATFDLISYDGECRAKNGAGANCWVYLEDEIVGGADAVMVPGKLYMIYLTEETSTIRFKKKAGEAIHTNSLTVSAHAETTPNDGKDANWNGIANPATYRAYMNVDATNNLAQRFIPGTKPREDGHYEALNLNDKQAVGQPLFVQVDPNASTSVVVSRTDNKSAHAPLRAQAAEDNNEVRYAIGIAANGKLADRLYIQTADEKEDKYTIGKDMSKMGTSSYVAQIWVNRYDSKLCLSTMELTDNQADYPLGIYAPQAGEYMIFAPADVASGDNIYLTRDGIVVWNLTIAPYNASLDKGTISRYGLRIVRSNNAPSIATGVDEIRSDNPQCTKVFMDNHVYILRGEELYTITGQKAK